MISRTSKVVLAVSLAAFLPSLCLALPDLIGFDGRPYGGVYTSYCYDVQESQLYWGESVHLKFSVYNQGDTLAGSFAMRFYVSDDATIGDASDYLFGGSVVFTGIAVGGIRGYTTYGVTIPLPASDPVGGSSPYYIGMVVDYSNTVSEANEANNKNQGVGADMDSLTILTPVPDIQVSDSVDPAGDLGVNFGVVVDDGPTNAVGRETVMIINPDRAALGVAQNGITLASNTHFRIESIYSSIQDFISLSAGSNTVASLSRENWLVTICFDPTVTGRVTDILSIQSNDPDEPLVQVSLVGTGAPVPDVSVSADTLDFGDVASDGTGNKSLGGTVTIRNTGSGPLTVASNGVRLLSGADFRVLAITSSLSGTVNLSAGPAQIARKGAEAWTVAVAFDPAALGSLSDGLRITSDDPDEGETTVSLLGRGLTVQDIRATDSVAPGNDLALDYGGVHADGAGRECATGVVTLANTGEAPLTVASNGITLMAGVYEVVSVSSSTGGVVNLAAGPAVIAGDTQEMWDIALRFDPAAAGLTTNQLTVVSDDPDESPLRVSLRGTGLNEADIAVEDPVFPAGDLAAAFGPVLNDGAGKRTASLGFVLRNVGTQPLTVLSNGIRLATSSHYAITQVLSSVSGPVNLSAGSDVISATNSETWTASVRFDPSADGVLTNELDISSSDPNEALVRVALTGQGVRPQIGMTAPASDLGIPAEKAYRIAWTDSYSAGDAAIALFLDTDQNPAAGLVGIASALSEDDDADAFVWQPPAALTGGTYYVYARIADGTVTQGAYSAGRLKIEGVNSFRMLSPTETPDESYAFRYDYNGTVYSGRVTLVTGENVIVQCVPDGGGGTVCHEFRVTRVASLVDSESYAYDEMGRVVAVTNARGVVIQYTYDAMGRVERIETSSGSVTEFGYDPLGHPVSMRDGSGWTFYAYDELERMTSVTCSADATPGGAGDLAIGYEYDLAGQRTAVGYPGGTRITYGYDPAGRLTAVTNATAGEATAYAYDPTNGLLVTETLPVGVRIRHTYDGAARLTDLRYEKTSDSSLVVQYHYVLDAGGRRTELHMTAPDGGSTVTSKEQYVYDDLDRIVGAVYSDDGTFDASDRTVGYTYDGSGNRLTMTVNEDGGAPEEVRYYAYGNENRLLAVTNQAGAILARFYYDGAGNCVKRVTPADTAEFAYDDRNLPVRVVTGTNYVEYGYDGMGARAWKRVNGVLTRFVNDPSGAAWQTLEERDGAGAVTACYVYGTKRLSELRGGTPWYYGADALRSTRFLAGPGAALTNGCGYDAFGQLEAAGGAPAYGFAGERRDPETGLVYLRARYYDPDLGRFITKDPLGFSGGLNAYVYCGNNAVNRVDPLGLSDDFTDYINGPAKEQGLITGVGDVSSHEGEGYDHVVHTSTGNAVVDVLFSLPGIQPVVDMVIQAQNPELNDPNIEWDCHSRGGMLGDTWGIGDNYYGTPGKLGEAGTGSGHAWQEYINGPSSGAGVVNQGDWIPYLGRTMIREGAYGEPVIGWGWTFALPEPSAPAPTPAANLSSFSTPDVGGVLIDKAAQFVGSNLCDIVGATYDPVSHQVVFLGTNNAAAVKDINMDYFYTAIQAVYGSAVPPFVTLDPPAQMASPWVDLGDGDGVFEPGELGGFVLRYTPIWVDGRDDLRVRFRMHWGDTNYDFTAYLDGWVWSNIIAGSRYAMDLKITNWVGRPAGIQSNRFGYTQLHLSWKGQDTYYNLILTNNSASSYLVDSVNVVPDLQHRRYGGRVDGTRLGWVMYEADRVMKCLGVGVDNLTGARYASTNLPIPGYSNILERSLGGDEAGNIRFWFVPNEMTLKKHVDPETGRSTIVFDKASVALKTESLLRGLPQAPVARAFADHFNAHYDEFAARDWPVMDPNDPTGQTIIQVKIFERLREAMQAVSLARFLRDNGIPLDMWWLGSWAPPRAYSPKVVPTAYNEVTNGPQWVLLYGGVEVNKPNSYVPSATAESVGQVVLSQRPDAAGDLDGQAWAVSGTAQGNLQVVAASVDAQDQFGNVRLAEADLDFESPGDLRLTMGRFYDSGYVGAGWLGPGWRMLRYGLEFSRPSWYDENGLMRDAATNALATDTSYDTRLRSGDIRFVDYGARSFLEFHSSLQLGYDVDNLGRPIITTTGLGAGNVPTFTAGRWADGSALVQATNALKGYAVTRPDGTALSFDCQGLLLSITDRHDYALSYRYSTNGLLTNVTDSAGQSLAFSYNASNRLASVTGPGSEQVTYSYDARGRLTNALHVRSGAERRYAYNDQDQLTGVTRFNGLADLEAVPDLRGRSDELEDGRGNVFEYSFGVDPVTLATTSTVVDAGAGPDAAWTRETDADGRLTSVADPLGSEVQCAYWGDSLYPNEIRLPDPGRQPLEIVRNAFGLPLQVEDPENTGGLPVTFSYNAANLPVSVTNALGKRTAFGYNADNDLTSVSRFLGAVEARTGYGYSGGAVSAVTNPLGHSTRYLRDAVGRITNVIDATGVRIGLAYDTVGRVVRISDPRYSAPVTLAYNAFDAVTNITTPAGTVACGYDPATHRCTAITNMNGAVTRFEYDPATGDLLHMVRENRGYPAVTVSYEYDRFGRVSKVTLPGGEATGFAYDELGRVTGRAETDGRPPGPPQVLDSSAADSGVWTNAVNHLFTWAAPEADSGIEGYSWAFDASADTNADTAASELARNAVAEGMHTMQVRARSRAGLWGPAASFDLRVDTTTPSAVGATVSILKSPCGNYVVGNSVRAGWSGFSDGLAGVGWYYAGFSNRAGTANGLGTGDTAATLSGPVLNATNRVYVWARDRAGNIGSGAATGTVWVLDPAGDHDHDGMNNANEEVAGTGANDAGSVLWLSPQVRATAHNVELSWFAVSNRVYDLLSATGLTASSWTGVAGWSNRPGAQASMTYTTPVSSVERTLFKVRVRVP